MNHSVYITGHRHPDTDTIVSTLALAYLKKERKEDVVPIRIGTINPETAYILSRFQIEEPQLFDNIKTRVSDIDFDAPCVVSPKDSILTGWQKMRENDRKIVAVADKQNKLVGICTISDLTSALLASALGNLSFVADIPLDYLAETLHGKLIYQPKCYRSNGIIKIASSTSIGTNDQLSFIDDMVISSARSSSHKYVMEHGAGLLIVTQSEDVNEEILTLAKEKQCGIITTPYDLYACSQSICGAMPIEKVMTQNLITFGYQDYLDDVKKTIVESRFRSYPVIDEKGVIKGFLSRYHLFNHPKKKLILVDHNEVSQSISGIDEAEVVEIIDHHRIGDVMTNLPIRFRNEKVGACSTIITRMYQEYQVEIPKDIASILLGAIISDTMNFRSPTCTEQDRITADMLAEISGLDLNEYAQEIMMAGSNLRSRTEMQIVNNDTKEYLIRGKRVMIGQSMIYEASYLNQIKDRIQNYLDQYCEDKSLDLFVMLFTDINENGSYFLQSGKEKDIVKLAFENQAKEINGLFFVEGVLSRKQQVMPQISLAIENYLK